MYEIFEQIVSISKHELNVKIVRVIISGANTKWLMGCHFYLVIAKELFEMTIALEVGTIVVYMLGMIAIGMHVSKKNKSTEVYYLGGRQLGPFVTAMSAEASDMSSWLLMGLPGVALFGLVGTGQGSFAEAFWTAAGLATGTYLNWLIVAKPLRIYSEHIDANTIPDFFSNRFGEKKGALLLISAIIIVIFFVPYTASGFASVGKLFNTLFGVNYHTVMIIGALTIALYTVMGGFLASSFTDFVQSIIMTIALIIVLWFCVSTAGGWNAAISAPEQVVHGYFKLNAPDGSYSPLTIASNFAWGLGYFGMPHILLRFMAIADDKKIKTSRRIASVWVVISMAVAVTIGVLGYSVAKKIGIIGAANFDPERIIVYIADAIANVNPLFAIVGGLILSGILASTMSTASGQMLAASSSVSENIIHRFFIKDMSHQKSIIIARATVLCVTALGIAFAWNPDSSIFRIISFAWAGFGASFGPLMLCALFWRRTNVQGAIAGVISGGAMIFIWKFGIAKLGGIFGIYELLPSFLFSLIVIVVVSLATAEPDEKVLKEFDEVTAMRKSGKDVAELN